MKNYVSVQKELVHVFCVNDAAIFFGIQKLYENSPTSKKSLSLRVLTNSLELWLKDDKFRLEEHEESVNCKSRAVEGKQELPPYKSSSVIRLVQYSCLNVHT